jgi:hypothetical protein
MTRESIEELVLEFIIKGKEYITVEIEDDDTDDKIEQTFQLYYKVRGVVPVADQIMGWIEKVTLKNYDRYRVTFSDRYYLPEETDDYDLLLEDINDAIHFLYHRSYPLR